MKSRKNLIIIALVVLVSVVGLSYAFFNYYQVSQRNLQLITGEIYLRLNEGTEQISLINAFPETAEEARARDDNYITFTITGKNTTTNHDIFYEIDLTEGEPIEGRTRLAATDLRFDLIEMNGEEEIYLAYDQSFSDLNEHKVWIDEVLKNTTDEIERTYKLRMWISEDVLISDTDTNASYTTGEYKNSYASVKLAVSGDFNERYTDETCFDTSKELGNMQHNTATFTLNTSEEAVNICKAKMLSEVITGDVSDAQDGYQTFCEGTGTLYNGKIDFYDYIYALNNADDYVTSDDNHPTVQYFIDNGVITNYQRTSKYYSISTDTTAKETCVDYFMDEFSNSTISDVANATAEEIESQFCLDEQGISSWNSGLSYGFVFGMDVYGVGLPDINYLIENNVLLEDAEADILDLSIVNYDISCGTEVFIPKSINGNIITKIEGSFPKNITRVVFANSLRRIESMSFYSSQMNGSLIIPGSVEFIGHSAFERNNLDYLYLEDGVVEIDYSAFADNEIKDAVIPLSVTSIDRSILANNQLPDEKAFIYNRLDENGDGVAEFDTTTINSYGGASDNVIIPDGVTTIGRVAFGSAGIETVKFPDTLQIIGYQAFSNNNLKNIVIPDGVTTIDNAAFWYNKLETVTIGSGIQYMGAQPFDSTLSKLTINKTCEEIKSIPKSSTDATLGYPWGLSGKIYDINGNVCN